MAGSWRREMRRPSAGGVLAVATVLPALVVAGWLLAGLPLLMLGVFGPLPVTLLAVVVVAVLCRVVLPRVTRAASAGGWQLAGVLGVAVASGVFNAVFHSEQLVVRRDPATYAQYTTWIAQHGSLPIPRQEWAFGGAAGLVFRSVGFYDYGGAVVPQFMPGPPMLYAGFEWAGALFAGPAVLGALAVLTVAGAAGRLVGWRWAPLAAGAFAVSLPILYTSRTTFSEIPSLILLVGALALSAELLRRPTGGAGRRGSRGCCSGWRSWCGSTGCATCCRSSRSPGC